MSGISTGVGLISGINTAQLIEQLMALESRPVTMLQTRSKTIDAQRAAFLSISAQILAAKNAAANFKKISFFRQFTSKTSDETVLSAVAGESAVVGSTTFRVHSLVSTHALASRGFADADRTPIGIGAIHLESAIARVDRATDLDELNGGRGVRRGTITITDRSGASADIDLSMAFTVQDVLDAINSSTKVNVRASVTGVAMNGASGDRIVIEDESGGTGALIIADKNGGFTAKDLGISANVSASRIDGEDIYRLSDSTQIAALNDGNGIDRLGPGEGDDFAIQTSLGNFGVSLSSTMRDVTDLRALNGGNGVRLGVIRITDRTGASAEVDLTQAKTVGDVHAALSATGLKITASFTNSRFTITDTSKPTPPTNPTPDEEPDPDIPEPVLKTLKVEDVRGFTAADLGIMAEVEGDTIRGNEVYKVTSVGDLVRAINFATGNDGYVEAAISDDGTGITLRALGDGNTATVVSNGTGSVRVSNAAADLGILGATFSSGADFTSTPLVGGLNTVLLKSLNGGRGVSTGVVSITDGLGRTAQVDFTSARTLQDVVDILNSGSGLSITASINGVGNGIVLNDTAAAGGTISISDVSGTLAADLGIAGDFDAASASQIKSANLQRQYITRQTSLDVLNEGRGIELGVLRITDSAGAVYSVNLDSGHKTVGEIIDFINLVTPDTITARINDGGDGIAIVDSSTGTGRLKIEDVDNGTVAADLRLAGVARQGTKVIDGSYELVVDVSASDSLATIASKVNALKGGFSATVMNDGGGTNPFTLAITSATSGRKGELMIDAGELDFGFSTLTRGQDAIVTVGQSGAGSSMLVTNSTNTLTNVVPGVTINLLSESDSDVTVTTDQDIDSMVESMQAFVDAYNKAQEAIDSSIAFNEESQSRGPLMGDSTVSLTRSRLHSAMSRSFPEADPRVARLFSIGMRVGANNRLEFNADRFRDTYEATPEIVEELFTEAESGLGARLEETLDTLTRSFDGVLARKDELLGDQQEVLSNRIASLNILLAAKRKRLETQFAGLESSLAALQGQQNALNELALLASQ